MSEVSERNTHLCLAEVLDLNAAAPLRDALLALRGQPVEVDGSKVQRLGGLCLQILLAARTTWSNDGADLVFTSPSQELSECLASFGADLFEAAA